MLEEFLEYIKTKEHLDAVEVKDYDLKGYTLSNYKFKYGSISYLKREEFLHHEEYLAIVPIYKDSPILEMLTEKKTIRLFLVDVCIEKNRRYLILEDVLKGRMTTDSLKYVLQSTTGREEDKELFLKYLECYFDMVSDMPNVDSDDRRVILKTYVYTLYAGSNIYSSDIIKKIGLEETKDMFGKYMYFSIDTSMVHHADDLKIRRLYEIIKANPEAGYMLVFRGRSIPATFCEAYENKEKDGTPYLSIAFWDGDSGNLFDIRYSEIPDKVFMDGKQIDF